MHEQGRSLVPECAAVFLNAPPTVVQQDPVGGVTLRAVPVYLAPALIKPARDVCLASYVHEGTSRVHSWPHAFVYRVAVPSLCIMK